ncbi:heterokaryon incompatibility protein-domain-containing protein [Hypoxylon sp. FL1857]|nr:heterokaryon incompatibility protein-domain-containing protein [Hypoxylon sp. FL1857]
MASQLCDVCTTIPFQAIHEGTYSIKNGFTWRIGSLHELAQRTSCPFCSFVVNAVCDDKVSGTPRRKTRYETDCMKLKLGAYYFWINGVSIGTRIMFTSGARSHGLEVTNERINPKQVREWLDNCISSHDPDCSLTPLRLRDNAYLRSFRLIDVYNRCIVQFPTRPQYVALSYVWGRGPVCRLLQSNRDELMSPNGLDNYWDQIPLTVKDAISLVRDMELRYLWVDSLCLVQDDREDVMKGINVMDSVYEQCLFSIVASADPTQGLPGVQRPRRVSQISCDVLPGIRLLLSHRMEELIELTPYHQRAWTFQEYFLSRRKVVFLNGMVHFQCRTRYCSEDIRGSLPSSMANLLSSVRLDDDLLDVFYGFSVFLFYYSCRHMTYQSDGLNAMAGLCRRLGERGRCSLLQGIPVSSFDLYLPFQPRAKRIQRREGFPSWSWAGWIGPLHYGHFEPGDKNEWLCNSTWIVWYKRDASGVVSLVWDPEETPDFDSTNTELVGYRERRKFQLGTQSTNSGVPIAYTMPSLNLPLQTVSRPYPMLQFWTMAGFYTVSKSKLHHDFQLEELEDLRYDVYDARHMPCGFLLTDGARPDFQPGRVVELIMLSEDSMWMNSASFSDDEFGRSGDVYWALYIEWDGSIAERRGICQIYRSAVEQSLEPGPVWKEIILG